MYDMGMFMHFYIHLSFVSHISGNISDQEPSMSTRLKRQLHKMEKVDLQDDKGAYITIPCC